METNILCFVSSIFYVFQILGFVGIISSVFRHLNEL